MLGVQKCIAQLVSFECCYYTQMQQDDRADETSDKINAEAISRKGKTTKRGFITTYEINISSQEKLHPT